MFGFLKPKTTPLVGVDISSSSIKILELSRTHGRYVIENYGIEFLPSQSVVERNIKDVNKVGEAIRKLMKRMGCKLPFAAVAVAGSSVLTRIIQLNADLSELEMADQIEVEADRYIPYPLEEVYYDFEVLDPMLKRPEFVNVLLAVTRIETLDMRVAAIADAGLQATVVDVEGLAMERAFGLIAEHLPTKGTGSNVAVIDLGSANSTLYVFKDRRSIYSRDQAFGGKHLTDEIQRRYGLSAEEAVAAQKYGGLPEDYTTEVLTLFKETAVQQIGRALQVFFSSSEEAEIHYIVLAGGVAMLPGLDALIQEKLNIKTSIANPFVDMEIAERVNKNNLMEEASALMLTCGLALRTFDNE
ncbi:MAG TPA: pilus assembly protein PilM [Gammaproteobacteria bacterium]|nr:pilus assembly protein PilM [Gammaproteobacteria bacterium]